MDITTILCMDAGVQVVSFLKAKTKAEKSFYQLQKVLAKAEKYLAERQQHRQLVGLESSVWWSGGGGRGFLVTS